ncbi:LysR family transcriptional regulator [Vibrio tritonius]|uniref:LysR family transcriptional regulator n=1 Tax=Vibrio tritonius TaxID=1435069 RepID=UPI00315D4B56
MDNLRQIDLNLLTVLHALLIEKHVTRAATRLHKSQPAVSHSLALLRAHFDDPLLVRRGGHMELTAKADALIQPLSDTLTRLSGLLGSDRGFDSSNATGRFKLAMSDYATRIVLPRLVKYCRTHAPGIDLAISQVSRDTMLTQLTDGELDLALGLFPDAPNHIRVQTLFMENYISIANENSLPEGRNLSLEEWLERPHILVALRPDSRDEIERALALLGLERRIAVAMTHWGTAIDLLENTDLVLTVASRAIEASERYKNLRRFTPPLELPTFAYQQGWHNRWEHDPAHQWLRQAVVKCSQPIR